MNNTDLYPQLMQLLRERYSCRSYMPDKPIDHSVMAAILDAARLAPSATNRQPWTFLVIDSAEGRDKVCRAYDRDWFRDAPAYIIAFGDHEAAWHRPYDGKDHTDVDLSIAIEHICLAATSLGVGTCWVCNFDPAILRAEFNVPAHLEPVAIIPVGYPTSDDVPVKKRKTPDEIIRFGSL